MRNLNFILEQINGVASILTFAVLMSLTYLIWEWVDYKHKETWHGFFTALPVAIAFAFTLYIDKIGTMIVRGVTWVWRTFANGSVPFTEAQILLLMLGTATTSVGSLLMIRLLTMNRFGEWPWVGSATIAAGYVLVSSGIHFW